MQAKKCDVCPPDTAVNTSLRICQQVPHYTDFTTLENYNLGTLSKLPTPPEGLEPCPEDAPYFADKCQKCVLPKYWNVSSGACLSCPKKQVFNLNSKTCITPQGTALTNLIGTGWVTELGNATNVLA